MKVCRNIYLGTGITESSRVMKWKIKHNMICKDYYLVFLTPQGSANLLDIYKADQVKKIRKYIKCCVVGAAGDKNEAAEVAGKIIDEVYKNTGEFDIRKYILQQGVE